MTDKEAVERCKLIIKDNNEVIKEARKNRDINSMQLTASLDNDSIAIETVLNLLEKKDKESHFIQSELDIANAKIIELNKIIDEMAGYMATHKCWIYDFEQAFSKDIREYFENKVEGDK